MIAGPVPRVPDSVGLGWGPRACISNKLSGHADTASPWTTLGNKKSEDKSEQFSQNSKEMVKELQMLKEKLKSEPRTTMELLHREENKGDREKNEVHVSFNFRKTYESNSSYQYSKAEIPHNSDRRQK